jgi:hypothetical protein
MKAHCLLTRLAVAALYFPVSVFAVTLDPGPIGNYFTFTNADNVIALDGSAFRIEFTDQKYLAISPYEADARFAFGIDFNSTGLAATPVAGHLTDDLGNEIAGTSFTGTAISAGFGGGIVTLNEVVIAYGAHITFTDTAPAVPFQVRFGSGVLSNVFEDRPVIGQGDPPEPGTVSIDAVAACSGPDFFEFEVTATATSGEMVFRIAADSDPDPLLGPTERITTQINALSGEINSEAEPIAESFGSPPYDRWLDGSLSTYSIDPVGDEGSSWTFSGRVPHGAEPFVDGDSLWGVTLSGGEAEVSSDPVVISACESSITQVSVPSRRAPVLDGRIDYREWSVAPQIELAGGSITFMHDDLRLFILINMREDGSDNALRDGGPDQFSLLFDIDEDGAISPDLDRRYRMLDGSGNFRFETWADAAGSAFNPPAQMSFSALGEGFGCFIFDGSATISPLSCSSHRVWEVAMDLVEIDASGDKTARLGLQVQSEVNAVESFPGDLAALSEFIHLHLQGRTNMDAPSRGMPTTPLDLAEFHVTQGIQREDHGLSLVQSRKAYIDMLVDVEEEGAGDVTVSLFAARAGVDLPGSPFAFSLRYNANWGSSNIRSGPIRKTYSLPGESLAGEMSFQLMARQPLLESSIVANPQQSSFVATDTPVYWIVPFNTADVASPNLPSGEFLLRSQLDVRAAFPVANVDFVQRPPLLADPETPEDVIDLLNQYDQQAVLAWTLGLLFTGEVPFALPDQIIGALPADKDFDDLAGLSDPRWWLGGAARVVWIKDLVADVGLLLPHELNHNLDTNVQGSWGRHVMGCGSEGLDPHWPYPNFQIQQPGLVTEDVIGRNERLLGPPRRVDASTPDYMSYCRAIFGSRDTPSEAYPFNWMSPHRWQVQLDNVFASAAVPLSAMRSTGAASFTVTPTIAAMLYITGQVNQDGTGSLDPILMQPGVVRADQNPGEYALRLADCDNNTLVEKSFGASFENVEGRPRDRTTFAMVLPDPGEVCAVQLLNGDIPLAERRLSANAPEVLILAPNGGETWTGMHTLSWLATDADADADADDNSTTATVLYSADGGSSWLPVAGGIQGEEYVVNSATLTGSEQALFRVLVTDGMHTAQDDSDFVFTVAEKAPTVSIVTPSADGQVSSAEPVILRGAARDAAGVELSGDSFVWELNGEPIAVGNSISAALPPGEQQLSLVVTADNGMSEQVSVILNVAGSDSDGDGIADENDSCPDSLPGSVVIVADCPTQVENFLYNNGCSLEELVNTALNQGGRQGLIEMLQAMRKRGELDHQDQKVIKRCVREDD